MVHRIIPRGLNFIDPQRLQCAGRVRTRKLGQKHESPHTTRLWQMTNFKLRNYFYRKIHHIDPFFSINLTILFRVNLSFLFVGY